MNHSSSLLRGLPLGLLLLLFAGSSRGDVILAQHGPALQTTCSGRALVFPQWFVLGIQDGSGCALTTMSVRANSAVEAVLCATDAYPYGSVVIATQPQSYCFKLKNLGTHNVYVTAFSPAAAARCAQNQCLNCSVTGC